MEINEKLKKLRLEIEKRISGSKKKDDRLNAMDLKNILSEQISKYNVILLDKVEKDTKSLNRKIAQIRIINSKVPYIESITPIIHEDGSQELIVNFSCNDEYKGYATITKDLGVKFHFLNSHFSKTDVLKALKKNVVNFITYFNAMDSFCLEYPGFGYVWNRNENNIYAEEINDGFISANIDLNNLSSTRATLCKIEDLELARLRTKEYGELYDFVDFYNDRILTSLKVDEENLNPLYKQILSHHRNEDKSCLRKLRVK